MKLKTLTLISSVMLLVGCQTMQNLAAGDGSLNSADRQAAVAMADLTVMRCTKVVTRGVETVSTGRVISKNPAVVTRLWKGGEWYRAESRTEGVTDYVYLNENTQAFICGEKKWNTFPESRLVAFIDVLNPRASARGAMPNTSNERTREVFTGSNEITARDLNKLIDFFGGTSACNVQVMLKNLDDALLIRLIGSEIIKSGMPSTQNFLQKNFYQHALQGNSIPNAGDKATLQETILGGGCVTSTFDFDSKVLKEYWAEDVRVRNQLRSELLQDRVTYRQIMSRITEAQKMSPQIESELAAAMQRNPELATKLLEKMGSVMEFMGPFLKKYGLS